MGLEDKTDQALSPVLVRFYGFFSFIIFYNLLIVTFQSSPTDYKPFPIDLF